MTQVKLLEIVDGFIHVVACHEIGSFKDVLKCMQPADFC